LAALYDEIAYYVEIKNDFDSGKKLLARMDAVYPKEELTLLAHILLGDDVELFKRERAPDEGSFPEREIPTKFKLYAATPNPFNPTTTISYDLPVDSHVRLIVYDILGHEIKRLMDEFKEQGKYSVLFDGSKLSSGIYLIIFEADHFTRVAKVMLIK